MTPLFIVWDPNDYTQHTSTFVAANYQSYLFSLADQWNN